MDENPNPFEHIPFDLIAGEILPGLPAKSLLRFTSVSKNWNSIIKSPHFFAAHLHHNQSETGGEYPLILDNDYCYIFKNQEAVFFTQLDDPLLKSFVYRTRTAESCNGLILVDHDIDQTLTVLLWNPSIRKFKKIYTNDTDCTTEVYGLGFHEPSNDHRVVRIVYLDSVFKKYYEEKKFSIKVEVSKVEVYSLSTDSWHSVDSRPGRVIDENGVYLHGCIHWLNEELCLIILFDFEKECFREMALPEEEFNYENAYFVSLNEFQGSLAVFYLERDYNRYDVYEECHMVYMTEYGVSESWTKKVSITLPRECSVPVGSTKNGIIVYEDIDLDSRYIFMDVQNGQWKCIQMRGNILVTGYMESLALLCCDDSSEDED